MSPLRIAVVGAGRPNVATSNHLPAIQHVHGATLVAVCDVREEGVRQIADQYGVRAYTDFAEMLEDGEFDIVDLCTPDYLHAEQTILAAQAGKHVLCEKPMALSIEEAYRMKDAVEEANVQFMCAMVQRWRPRHRAIKAQIESSTIGEVVYLSYRSKGAFFSYESDSFYRSRTSHGPFVHNGPHYVDLLAWFADSLPQSVYALSTRHYVGEDAMETDNYFSVQLRFENGALGWVELNQLMVSPRGFPSRTVLTIIGTQGTLVWDNWKASPLQMYRRGQVLYSDAPARFPEEDSFVGEIRHFVECVRTGQTPLISIDHSIRVLTMCLHAVQSAEMGRTYYVIA